MRDARNDDSRPEDDQAAIDRAFAELVADFHRAPDVPARPTAAESGNDLEAPTSSDPEPSDRSPEPATEDLVDGPVWPVERRPEPEPEPKPARPPFEFRLDLDAPPDHDTEPPEERYIPPPAPPLPRPTAPVFVGWLGIIYSIVVMFLLAFGVPLPQWVGWIGIAAFLGGLALLLSRLPRHRPPDDDDGARL